MTHVLRNIPSEKPSSLPKMRGLPMKLEAAPPIENEKLLALLIGQDITISGGTHSTVSGRPALEALDGR